MRHGDWCRNWYKGQAEFYDKRMDNAMKYARDNGRLSDDKEEMIRNTLITQITNPKIMVRDLKFIFKFLGFSGYDHRDAAALMKWFTGKMGTLSFRVAFLHHPDRYDICKIIYKTLVTAGNVSDSDKYDLVVGNEFNSDIEVAKIGMEKDREVFESSNYVLKVGHQLNVEDSNFKELVEFLEGSSGHKIEFFYPEKNVLVLHK